ncbi:4-hydroxyphenylacetate 3-hydroxylase family protein [Pseudoramibacter sp.]|jgi:4-hydroxybutyryl-CoA dehydratase/vinylacetyl-CoA-Delta-isomerase|uniref:4-hydroxyphenylacetate 3-hydroxylase family protein n=1 Tax=Pseudoramibacter sp. TaxID=2034862 RepID=UPI0025F9D76B|nr:4-hydroxyphenylacetate 3-hydroxylase family protein [Pseudoramibacter sp.]MCH4072107.1 4-hydroxyphenylacetate 3-hydroxylase family protein [Pseudoramibacter sp.]MCH4105877.1 4-hydroxyphenylacetate 3-hydroxylase family protein [Pseudoramibacter sp.]
MALMTGDEYIESLRKLKTRVYIFGEQVENWVDHPIVRPSINSVKMTYDLAQDPKYQDLMTATSNLTGEKVNRFNHLHQSTDDLVRKVKMQRLLGQKTASCFQRCVGMDAFNAVYSTTYETDEAHGTHYHENFINFLKMVQKNDYVVDGAMTDPKGDRNLAPHAQKDPDMYVHVVERRDDGIVVRGAKAHQTGSINSHWHLIMPTIAMKEADKDYAVSFACPSDADGVYMIYGRQSCDTRKLEDTKNDCGNPKFGGQEALVVFDDVFIPNEYVFLDGEYDFSGMMVERFAGYHRQSYGGCKTGVGDVLIGAAALAAEYNGVQKASHIKDKLIEMTHLNETMYACGIACSAEGHKTKAGNYLIDLLLANVCKQNVTRFPYEIVRLAEDIAGGLMVTMPSDKDFTSDTVAGKNGETICDICHKYFAGDASVPTVDRQKLMRFIENMCLGTAAVGYTVESLHGAGSPQAQRIMIARQGNIEGKKELAKAAADIED